MPVLPSDLRNRLENTVKAARRQAEAAARAALERLTVGNTEPGGHLSVEERQLRNRLRAHGRQLGDQRDPKAGTQSTNRWSTSAPTSTGTGCCSPGSCPRTNCSFMRRKGCRSRWRSAMNWRRMKVRRTAGPLLPATPPGCYRRYSALTTRCSRSALRRSTSAAWRSCSPSCRAQSSLRTTASAGSISLAVGTQGRGQQVR